MSAPQIRLDELRFDNRFTADLPADMSVEAGSREVPGAAFSRVETRKATKPVLVAWSAEMLEALDLDPEVVSDSRFAEVFVGNEALSGMDLHAARYGGHQFGHWAGQLGDGRAIVLGEVVNRAGARHTLQLKGAGPTPYSRRADGLAVLRSSLREFICSEAMHHLGVPTTRALSLILTGDEVVRDMFYDGRPELEPGAVVCRIAPSFVRFGNFQLPAAMGERELLERLVTHTLDLHFPWIEGDLSERVVGLYREVVRSTAKMVVEWQRVGFVHGVMNTDNMSIHGLTIDYGPYGWLEDYDPGWTPNTTDGQMRRYAFGAQPKIAQWNLAQLGSALAPLVDDIAALQAEVDAYAELFHLGFQSMTAKKLGLQAFDAARDTELFESLFGLLGKVETDMTLWFRRLGELGSAPLERDQLVEHFYESYYREEQIDDAYAEQLEGFIENWRARSSDDSRSDEERREAMHWVNPLYVPRNYLAQLAIDDAAKGDFSRVREWLDTLRRPYEVQPGRERFAERRPDWARSRPGCSQLSCSS